MRRVFTLVLVAILSVYAQNDDDDSVSSSASTTGAPPPVSQSDMNMVYVIIALCIAAPCFTIALVVGITKCRRGSDKYGGDSDDEKCFGETRRRRQEKRTREREARTVRPEPVSSPHDPRYGKLPMIAMSTYDDICDGADATKQAVPLPTGKYEGFYHITGGRRDGRIEMSFQLTIGAAEDLKMTGKDSTGASCEISYGRYGPRSWNVIFSCKISEPGFTEHVVDFTGTYNPHDQSMSGMCLRKAYLEQFPTQGTFSFKFIPDPNGPHYEALPSYEVAAAHDDVAHPFQDAPARPFQDPSAPPLLAESAPALPADGKCPNCHMPLGPVATSCAVCFWSPWNATEESKHVYI